MYINIGNEKTIRTKDIVAVFDFDSSTVSVNTKRFLTKKQKENKITTLGTDIPKSFILLRDDKVYISQLNTSTIIGKKLKSNKIL